MGILRPRFSTQGHTMAEDERNEQFGDRPRGDDAPRGRGPRGEGDRGGEGRPGMRRRSGGRRKVCRLCADKTLKVDYSDVRTLCSFITEGEKLVPSRTSGNCANHQRQLAVASK